jgi:hypothetical protein
MPEGDGEEDRRHDGDGWHDDTHPRSLAEEFAVRRPEQI